MTQRTQTGKKRVKFLVLISVCFFMHQSVYSQSMEAYKMFKSKEGNLNYLAPYLYLENDSIDFPYKNQSQYTYYSYLHEWDKITEPLFPKEKITYENISFKKATPYILQRTATEKVVMFNEEHHTPFHRLYVETFLEPLKEQGFTVLALETLNWEDTDLNKRKYPISISGSYTREPYFANLVRKALSLGYKVLPYESKDTLDYSIKTREKNQAANLARMATEEPGKILVVAGYAHISEKPIASGHGGSNEWMAYILKNEYCIDPLTIDQTEMPLTKELVEVSISFNHDTPYKPEKYDLSLFYPINREYMHTTLGKKKIRFTLDEKQCNKNWLVQFFIAEEYQAYKDKAIPYEQYLIDTIHLEVYLDPNKNYRMLIRNQKYQVMDDTLIADLNKE